MTCPRNGPPKCLVAVERVIISIHIADKAAFIGFVLYDAWRIAFRSSFAPYSLTTMPLSFYLCVHYPDLQFITVDCLHCRLIYHLGAITLKSQFCNIRFSFADIGNDSYWSAVLHALPELPLTAPFYNLLFGLGISLSAFSKLTDRGVK